MRAIDAKILDELEMLSGDRDCFYPIRDWFGKAEAHWANLERLFTVAEYAKKHNPSVIEKIAIYSRRIVELFQQTRDFANLWDSKRKKKHKRAASTEDYAEASDESLGILSEWTASQEELRCTILEFIELLRLVVSEP